MTSLGRAVWDRPGWVTGAALVVWAVLSCAWGEHVPRHEGCGWDGKWYRDLAQHFLEPNPELSVYGARRCLPSGCARAVLLACGAELTGPNLVVAFAAFNLALLLGTLAALLACCRTLGVGAPGQWFLCLGYFVNFPHLKDYHFRPVLTDPWAAALASLMLLGYLRRWQWLVAASGAIGAFVWPSLPHLAALLFLFPARRPRPGHATPPEAPAAPGKPLAALAALGLLVAAAYIFEVERYVGLHPVQMIPGLLPLSCALAAAYIYFALAPLFARDQLAFDRLALMGFVARLAVVALAFAALSQVDVRLRELYPAPHVFSGVSGFVRSVIYHGVSKPLLFVVEHVNWFGPLVVIAALNWVRVCREVRAAGLGLVLFVAAGLVQSIGPEARQMVCLFPVVAVFAAVVVDRQNWSPGRLTAFGAVALVASRVWLPLNSNSWPTEDLLYEYPMQRLFMLAGWPTTESYVLLAGCVLVLLVAVALVAPRYRMPRLVLRRVPATGPEA